jgi:signal transduction histidine kinase
VNLALQTAETLLAEAIRDTRRVSHELVPVMLKDYGLEAAIQDFCRRFEGTSTRLHCRVSGLAGRLESHLELALYRMGQELVNNIMKHSGATEALLLLAHQQEWIVLEAQDNGRGFVPEVREAKGIGLKMICDRVELLNGTLSIATPAGGGSRITICVPLAGKKA